MKAVAMLAALLLLATASDSALLHGAGATFPYPLISKWAEEYERISNVSIDYLPIGSGGGIEQITKGLVNFGASDAPLTPEEMKKAPGILHIPITLGGVAIAYNVPGLKEDLNLDGETAAGIFSGEISRWNDERIRRLNQGMEMPDERIRAVHRLDSSGTNFVFTSYLSAVSERWKEDIGSGKMVEWTDGIAAKGNDGVSEIISSLPYSVGYVELTYAIERGLSYASLKNSRGNFVEANLSTIRAAASAAASGLPDGGGDWSGVSLINASGRDSYPISTFSYLLVYRDQRDGAGKELVDFLWWTVHEGQNCAEDLHYAPLPPDVVGINERTIRMMRYQFRE